MRFPQRKRAATITRLRTRPERLKREQAEMLRQTVLSLDLPEQPISQVIAAIDRQVAPDEGWPFAMVSPDQNAAVVAWLAENSRRPVVALKLWSVLLQHLRRDTGEVVATRKELADAVGIQPGDVSRIMGDLKEIHAVATMKEGRGTRYFVNPNVATKLSGAAREEAQRAAGPVRLEVVR